MFSLNCHLVPLLANRWRLLLVCICCLRASAWTNLWNRLGTQLSHHAHDKCLIWHFYRLSLWRKANEYRLLSCYFNIYGTFHDCPSARNSHFQSQYNQHALGGVLMKDDLKNVGEAGGSTYQLSISIRCDRSRISKSCFTHSRVKVQVTITWN